MNKRRTAIDATTAESGFGLVEVVISMFLLTLISVGFLPLLVDALRVTVRNNTMATASQLVSEQLDLAGQLPRTCSAVNSFGSAAVPTSTDARGTVYTPRRAVGSCPASGYPVAVDLRVWVTVSSDPRLVVESRTTVIIESST